MAVESLTRALQTKLARPATSPDFDLHGGVDQVLADVGMSTEDSGGKLTFYGQDPIVPSGIRFGAMAAVGLAAKSVAVAALWRQMNGRGTGHPCRRPQGAEALLRFLRRQMGNNQRTWSRSCPDRDNPFFELPLFRRTRDGRHVVALNIYPRLQSRALNFLRCSDSTRIH